MTKKMTRMTLSLSERLEEDIFKILNNKAFTGTTKGDVIRNSIITYKLLLEELSKDNKLTITDKKGNLLKEIVMPY